jgi:hypothetical protein
MHRSARRACKHSQNPLRSLVEECRLMSRDLSLGVREYASM